MFCHKCGKETKEKGLCIKCFLEEHPPRIKKITLPICSCGKYLYHGNWNPSMEDSLENIVRENLILPSEIKLRDLELKQEFRENKILLEIHINGRYKNEEFKDKIQAYMEIEQRKCPNCTRISSSYYEAVLQFRSDNLPKKLVDSKFISKMEKVPGGFDLYLTSSSYAKKIAKDLNKKGFFIKESPQIVGMRKGKILHRLYLSIKAPEFKAGDFLEYRDKVLQVIKPGKSVLCRDIKSRREIMMPLPRLQRAKLIARRTDIRKAMVSSISPNEIQILDLKSYKTFELPGKFEGLKEKDEVEFLRIGRDVYLL